MEAYVLTHMYHRALQKWYEEKLHREITVSILEFTTALSALLVQLCSTYPTNSVLLLSSDGRIHCAKTMDEPAPSDFRVRRYIKIDNKVVSTSISQIVSYIYQLLSIIQEDHTISLLDTIGIVSFVLLLLKENGIEAVEWTKMIRKHIFGIPPFAVHHKDEWKGIQSLLLRQLTDHSSRTLEVEHLVNQESLLQQLSQCYRMVDTLHKTIQMQEERIRILEDICSTIVDKLE
jgi:hypothetical protein